MNITITGEILNVFPSEIVRQNFEKRMLWLQELNPANPQYVNCWEIEFQQGACNKLDGYRYGQKVEVKVNLRGRKLNKKANNEEFIINTLNGWDIRLMPDQFAQQGQQPQQQAQPQQQQQRPTQQQQTQQYQQPQQQQQPGYQNPNLWQQPNQQQQGNQFPQNPNEPDDLPF